MTKAPPPLARECSQVDKCLERLESAARGLATGQDMLSVDMQAVTVRLVAIERHFGRIREEIETLSGKIEHGLKIKRGSLCRELGQKATKKGTRGRR